MTVDPFPVDALKELLNIISSGVCLYRVENEGTSGSDYRVVYFNSYALVHEGRTMEEIQGLSLKDLRPTIDDYGLIDVFHRVWKTGEPAFFPAKIYTDDNFANWYENRVFKVSDDLIVAVYDDVTDREAARETVRGYIDNAPYGFFIADGNGKYIDVNQEAERITGYTRDELLEMSIPDLIPDDAKAVAAGHFNGVKERGYSIGEIDFLKKDGSRRTWNVRAVGLSNNTFMAFCTDITDEKNRAEELRRNQARYRQAEKIGRMGAWEYDFSSGEFWGSDGAKRIYGLPENRSHFSPDEVESCIPERERVHRALVDLIQEGKPYDLEFQLIPRDAHDPRTITSVAELLRNEKGEPLKVTGMIQDVTERVKADDALRESDRRYRQLFDTMRDVLLMTDGKRNLIDCNDAFLRVFRCTREECIGRSVNWLYSSEDEFNRVGRIIEAARKDGSIPQVKALLKRGDGELFTGELNIHSREDSTGRFLGVTGVIRDVSQRELLESQLRQSQKMEAIGKLAGGIAHDFNNLLTIINGYIYMLMEGRDPGGSGYREMSEIMKAGHRAAELTGQLLAFSRKQMLKPEVIRVNERIGETENMLRRIIGEHILLETRYSPESMSVKVDPGQLDQIIMNLCVNSRDAMPGGGRLLIQTEAVDLSPDEASACGLETSGRLVKITVKDNGSGISSEHISHVFEPFYTTKARGEGTGMGLPTVYGIVKQSGGDLSLESSKNSGTTISIYLPRVEGTSSSSAGEAFSDLPAGNGVILLVEDEPSVRELIQISLEAAGFTVRSSENGHSALILLGRMAEPPDVLLTDVMMPGLSGRDLADRVLSEYPDISVCFMSGYTDDTVEKLGILQGGFNFIQKPFLPSSIAEKMRSIIKEKNEQTSS